MPLQMKNISIGKGSNMKKEYDFSNGIKNPYAKKLKKLISIRIDDDVIDYFKGVAEDVGVPYQGLMNLYLRQAKAQMLKPQFVKDLKSITKQKKAA